MRIAAPTRPTRAASHLNPQLQSMGMVRSPKSIAGAVEVALGNAPYKIGDRTVNIILAQQWYYLAQT
jgi:hypothetical protein